MTHLPPLPPPIPPVSLFAFVLRATWRPVQPLTAPTRSPGPSGPGTPPTHPGALLPPGGSQSSGSGPLCRPPSRVSTPARVRPPVLRPPSLPPGREARASSLPPQLVREGKGAGRTGGVTAPARTGASCSLASVPRASWLFRLGRRWRLGLLVAEGGGPPQAPSPLPTQEEPLLPAGLRLLWRWVRLGTGPDPCAQDPEPAALQDPPIGADRGSLGSPPSLLLEPAGLDELEKDHEGG